MAFQGSNWKPSRALRKKAKVDERRKIKLAEDQHKKTVRIRDRRCRFPWCGCKNIGLSQEVSHLVHKGMGGDASGERSQPEGMILLCDHRHRLGAVSIHHGTMKITPQTAEGTRGPVTFWIDAKALHGLSGGDPAWVPVASEVSRGRLMEPTTAQAKILSWLAEMEK